MPSLSETVSSLYGALRLARFDAGGMVHFNATVEGFWRSFFAAVLVLPLYAIGAANHFPPEANPDVGLPRFLLVEDLTYVIAWLAYPVVMVSLTRAMGCWERFVPYIVAYNWCAVWQNLLLVPVALLGDVGVLPGGMSTFLFLAVLGYVLVYVWFVARTALALPPFTCAAIVILDMALGVVIMTGSDALY